MLMVIRGEGSLRPFLLQEAETSSSSSLTRQQGCECDDCSSPASGHGSPERPLGHESANVRVEKSIFTGFIVFLWGFIKLSDV